MCIQCVPSSCPCTNLPAYQPASLSNGHKPPVPTSSSIPPTNPLSSFPHSPYLSSRSAGSRVASVSGSPYHRTSYIFSPPCHLQRTTSLTPNPDRSSSTPTIPLHGLRLQAAAAPPACAMASAAEGRAGRAPPPLLPAAAGGTDGAAEAPWARGCIWGEAWCGPLCRVCALPEGGEGVSWLQS